MKQAIPSGMACFVVDKSGFVGCKSVGARDSIEILWYLIPVRCTIELTEKEQWGSYPLFLKKGMPVHGRGLDISMPELK
jgi:hypothetical protein